MSSYRGSTMGGILFTVSTLFLIVSLSVPKAHSSAAQDLLIQRISAGSNGIGGGTYASISANGRYVAFESSAPDLSAGHIDQSWDTYVRDRLSSIFQRVSTQSDGTPSYNEGDYTAPPRISSSGRYVAFVSRAENLVSNDANGMPDVFLKDRQTGLTSLVSVGLDGKSSNADSYNPAVTPDGRYVAFESYSSNLVQGDTNNAPDIFLRDLVNGVTERVSVNSAGQQGSDPHDIGGFSSVAISDNGLLVAFSYQGLPVSSQSGAGPFIYLRDRGSRTTREIAPGEFPALSGSGRFLVFVSGAALVSADTNHAQDVYLFDQQSGKFERISVSSDGVQVAWQDILSAPGVSADGNKVVFESSSDELAEGDTNGLTDIFLRSRSAGTTLLVSASVVGSSGNGESHSPAISADGSTVAFSSGASNLVADDTNNRFDVFVFGPASFGSSFSIKIYIPVVSH